MKTILKFIISFIVYVLILSIPLSDDQLLFDLVRASIVDNPLTQTIIEIVSGFLQDLGISDLFGQSSSDY